MRGGEKLGRLLRLASAQFEAEKRALVAEQGITPSQMDVLEYLADQGGAAAQTDIVAHLRASRATVSGLVSRLERMGLAFRDGDERPGRVVVVHLADKAWPIVQACHERLEGMDERLTAGFTEDERTTLVRLLREMVGSDGSA